MARIVNFRFISHLRAEPNQYILHFRGGKLVRQGAGLAYWFQPLAAAVAQLPVEDIESTVVLHERSADFQELMVQMTLTYRITNRESAARRVNFGISLTSGQWLEQPLDRLANMWSHWGQYAVRERLIEMSVVEAVRSGPGSIRSALIEALRSNPEIGEMGLALVDAQIDRIAPTPELEKAMQVPTREAIQQKADEATFSRRALAVEKERAIKENELATQIELARREEELISRRGMNEMLLVKQQAERDQFSAESEKKHRTIRAEAVAEETRIQKAAEAQAHKTLLELEAEAERNRVRTWKDAPSSVVLGLALQRLAENVDKVDSLNLTPDLVGRALNRLLSADDSGHGSK